MFRKKIFWQVVLGLLILALTVFFIRNEHLEISNISARLSASNPWYVLLGICVTGIYILLQALMYVESFACVRQKVSFTSSLTLFLKRNLISVFLPAGGVSSLAFFTREIEKQNVQKSQIYYASYIYAVSGMLSVVVVAIPALLLLLFRNTLTSTEIIAFLALIALILIVTGIGYSLIKKGFIYNLAQKIFPELVVLVDELQSSEFSTRHFILTNLTSLLIEFAGIAHLYIAMLALGLTPSLELAAIGYVVMVILLVVSPVLRGLGAIEVTLTFLFIQYGFSKEIAASATLLFRFFEFWLPLIAGVFSFYTKKDSIFIRIVPALLILILGIINIVSAITPAIPGRLEMVKTILSHNVIYISNYLVIVFGLVLCIVSIYLFRGVRTAWWIAIFIGALSIIGHISKAFDYEEATLGIVAVVSLLITRKEYIVRPDRRFQRRGLTSFALVFAAMMAYGIIGFYFLDKRNFGIDFSLAHSVRSMLRLFFLFDTGDLIPRTHFAHYFINSIYTSSIVAILMAVYMIIKPYLSRPTTNTEDTEKTRQLVERFGNSALDYFKTYQDKLFFFSKKVEGFIAFRTTPVFAVVLEKPVCQNDENARTIIHEFEAWCEENGLKAVYYRVSAQDLAIFRSIGKKTLKIGQEAIVDLEKFSLSGKDMKPMRNALNKISSAGYVFKTYDPPVKEGVIQKLKQVSDEWLAEKKEVVFDSGIFDPAILKMHTIFTVENTEEKIVAFANQIPDYAKGEATYDLIRKSADAPGGVVDFLLVNMFDIFRKQGCTKANMGMAPMSGLDSAGNIAERTIKLAYENIRRFGHFKGLRDYKEKFMPYWQNKYLVYSNDYNLLQLPTALNEVTKTDSYQ